MTFKHFYIEGTHTHTRCRHIQDQLLSEVVIKCFHIENNESTLINAPFYNITLRV